MMSFQFTLPQGFVDTAGVVHREGMIRLTTGQDELMLQWDAQARENPAYGVLILLSRTIVQLGKLSGLTPQMLEGLLLPDLHYLIECYNQINPEPQLSLVGEW
jgi:hypothetical protein